MHVHGFKFEGLKAGGISVTSSIQFVEVCYIEVVGCSGSDYGLSLHLASKIVIYGVFLLSLFFSDYLYAFSLISQRDLSFPACYMCEVEVCPH